jgi:hypothetical protein
MSLSKLSVFTRETDADETLKGYEYQKLRTLEIWLSNKVNGVGENIYCEYEDDVFQQNINEGKSKFTQLKLYGSKSFSFQSNEVLKAITNFFSLFVKGEYKFDEIEFVFETNTAIAGKYGGNDSELLTEWASNTGQLEGDLLKRCAAKLKSIVTEFVQERLPELIKKDKSLAQIAEIEFANIPETVWEDFAKSIRWIFNEESPNDAIEKVNDSIKSLIKSLPFPASKNQSEQAFTALYYEVSEKMFQQDPGERCLTPQRMDELLLDLGNEVDQQYGIVFQGWSGVVEIKYFRLGEFLEILNSANYCRVSTYLEQHSTFWLNLLSLYINHADTPNKYRQKAIYEFLWLSLRPRWFNIPSGTLAGLANLIREYFSKIGEFADHDSVEDHFSLLQIIRASIVMDKCDVPMGETNDWFKAIGDTIQKGVEAAADPAQKCYWLELQAEYLAHPLTMDGKEPDMEKVFETYGEVLRLIPHSPLYNVSRLSDRINQIIKIYIQLKMDSDKVHRLENLSDQIMPHVNDRGGAHAMAKVYRDRAIKYMESEDPLQLGAALSYLHKAKELWYNAGINQGYLLSLLTISQVYSAFHMNFAAKYYALSAAWFCVHTNPELYIPRMTAAFGLMCDADFKQGSWISSLDSFRYYVRSRLEWEKKGIDEPDDVLKKTFMNVAGIMSIAPKITPHLSGFIEFHKQIMGHIYTDYLEPLQQVFEKQLEKESLTDLISRFCDAPPINDIGSTRTIEWKAFGSVWSVTFPNTWEYCSLGEEFAAFMQILLVELASTNTDLHCIKTHIEIELQIIGGVKQPEQLPSNHNFKWKVFTKVTESSDQFEQKYQMGSLTVTARMLLRDVSMLKDEDVVKIVMGLLEHGGLDHKAMVGSLYQRIYRGLFSKESFEESKRHILNKETFSIEISEAAPLSWNANLSSYYSEDDSLAQIKGRYENALKGTHLTIEHIKKDHGYKKWIGDLRSKGWLDWQILMAMYNHILSYKASLPIRRQSFPNEEAQRHAFESEFQKIRRDDESVNYVQFPLEYFIGHEFELQLNHTGYLVMKTWGLENLASFPNFPAIRDFLNHRFNYGIDDIKSLSPF